VQTFIRKTVLGLTLAGTILGVGAAMAPAASAAEANNYADVWATSPRTFYPLVDDNYRDRLAFRVDWESGDAWGTDGDCATERWVSIENVDTGAIVREWSREYSGCELWDAASFTWNGRRANGRKVAAGRYLVDVEWYGEASPTPWVTTRVGQDGMLVTVATGHRTVTRWIDQPGNAAVSKTKTGNCNWSPQIDRGIQLTCLGGTGRAVWKARVPAGFKVASVKVPCERGLVPCRGERVSWDLRARRLTITFEVRSPSWSQCIVYGPLVKLTDQVRI
jgi:hypothetical protein